MADLLNDGFVLGTVFHSSPQSETDRERAIRAIEDVMVEYDILKIDVCLDPYRFPQNLIDLRNGKTR